MNFYISFIKSYGFKQKLTNEQIFYVQSLSKIEYL